MLGCSEELPENHDLAIEGSSSSRADPGLRVAFECLNVQISVMALAGGGF